MSALLSRYLGAREYDRADKVAHNGFILVAINYTIFFIVGCLAGPIMRLMTSDSTNAQIIADGTIYLRITQWLSFAPMIQSMFERLLQGTGKTKYIFYMQVAGTLFNAVVDPILIFGLFGLPRMGAKGAALATVFGQLFGCVLGHIFNKKYNKEVALHISKIRPHLRTMREIYRIAIPSIVLQAMGAVMNFSLNKILSMFSDLAVTTFGVYFKLQSFVFMPIFGMNNGSVPIIAYNYGADRRDRLEHTMSLGVRYGVGVMSVGTLIFWLFPEQLMALFSAPPEMVSMGIVALHIMSLNFPFAGFCIMRGAAFQALGKSVYSMNISIMRQLIVIIPCAYIFAKIGGVDMVWWAFPLAEIVGVTMSIIYTKRIRKTIISKMTPRDAEGNALQTEASVQ
jgi:putative MATE family efflux protein